jgi:hypothetical protein
MATKRKKAPVRRKGVGLNRSAAPEIEVLPPPPGLPQIDLPAVGLEPKDKSSVIRAAILQVCQETLIAHRTEILAKAKKLLEEG